MGILEAMWRSMLGCEWGVKVTLPDDTGVTCPDDGVRYVCLHDGTEDPAHYPVRLCERHAVLVELQTHALGNVDHRG